MFAWWLTLALVSQELTWERQWLLVRALQKLEGDTSLSREDLVAIARVLSWEIYPEVAPSGRCAYDTWVLLQVARKVGIRLVPQAGSCFWLCLDEAHDDGVSSNRFGYQWEPHSLQTRALLAQGMLPEMHVWAGDPETQTLIDLTTGQFPEQCKKLIGQEWQAPRPPDFLWCSARELPRNAWYEPSESATRVYVELMQAGTVGRQVR